jgi:hypothetical protein
MIVTRFFRDIFSGNSRQAGSVPNGPPKDAPELLSICRRAALPLVLLAGALLAAPEACLAQISIGISIHIAPPILPIYVQPVCPAPNYMWTPGYWAWSANDGDYYWVPGTWVLAPRPGYLWTPGYWGWGSGGVYVFHGGYWGTQVGFYGGVNYGFGFGGIGFAGGEWRGGSFAYNTAAVNVNSTVIHNTYVNKTVINNTTIVNNTHTSFNGGPNGVAAQPTPQQQAFASQPHIQPTPAQLQHEKVAGQDRSNFSKVNNGVPAHAAVPKPVSSVAELQRSAVPARAAPAARAATASKPAAAARPAANVHPAARPQESRPAARTASAPHPTPKPPPARKPAPAARPAPHEPAKEPRGEKRP